MGKIVEAIFGKQEKPAQAIPLRDAMLCMNCESIFEAGQMCCPVCASEVFMSVSLALSDDETKDRVREMSEESHVEYMEHLRRLGEKGLEFEEAIEQYVKEASVGVRR